MKAVMNRVLQGRVAVVTGASRGIGAEIALQLARNGARVVVNYFGNAAKAEEIAAKINEGEEELRGITFKADVTNSSEVRELFDRAEQCFGRVHIVVNNAGVLDSTCPFIADTSSQAWDWTFNVNCKATFLTCKEAARRLVHVEGGRIINITGTLVATLRPGFGAYAASKAAVETFTRVLARELQGTGVTANCVAPGPIATDMFYAVRDEESVLAIAKAPPLERLGECKDIAPLVAFLASDDGEPFNGLVLRVSGDKREQGDGRRGGHLGPQN